MGRAREVVGVSEVPEGLLDEATETTTHTRPRPSLVEFLTARLDELGSDWGCPGVGEYKGCDDRSDLLDRMVTAQQAIVATCVGWIEDGSNSAGEPVTSGAACGSLVLEAMALPYSAHPDYDEAWRP
jgi:hypothetical protein